MDKINNPHDHFFRKTWSDPRVAGDFLANYLPETIAKHIDLDKIKIQTGSFVDKDLQEHYSDILYEVGMKDSQGKKGFVYVLFEHKSFEPGHFLALDLLRYMLNIWRQHLRNEHTEAKLPMIIPFVVYHGKTKFHPLNLGQIIDIPSEDMQAFVPNFKYELADLSVHSETDIKGTILLRTCLLSLQAIFMDAPQEHLRRIFTMLEELGDQETALQYIEVVFKYIAGSTDKITFDEVKEIAAQAAPKREEKIMTIAEELFEKGMQQGQISTQKEVLRRLLSKKFNLSEQDSNYIQRVDDLERLNKALDEILVAKNKKDVLRHLQ